MSSSTLCLRCLKRSLGPVESVSPLSATQRAAFSTTPSLAANPPKKKNVVAKPAARQGKSLKLAKNKRATTTRPPAPGERKALRKRVVLSNTNALEVHGLPDLTAEHVNDVEKLRQQEGKVLGLGNDSVDALRALEAFKPTQGWSLFRRPATLVRRETVELAGALDAIRSAKTTDRRVLFGERGSGKSVLQLQGMAMAYLKGWLVLHFPEAREMTVAHHAYRPVQLADGRTGYIQPQYTAQLLSNIVKANHGLLNQLRLSKKHDLPVPVQANISLARFAELGASDAELAWPIWQAFWSELTAPSQPEKEGLQRPPLFLGMDGADYAMRNSAYLDAEARPVHAHDLTLIGDFVNVLSGRTQLPNGGCVVAASSASNRPGVPTLDFYLERNHAAASVPTFHSLLERLRGELSQLPSSKDLDLSYYQALPTSTLPPSLHEQLQQLLTHLTRLSRALRPVPALLHALDTAHQPQLPEWDPYTPIDSRVQSVMRDVSNVQKVSGLSKEEARGVMEYYARSGMLRQTVTEGMVSEKWTVSGQGVVGELERAAVRARF